jgi:hypothetical protein
MWFTLIVAIWSAPVPIPVGDYLGEDACKQAALAWRAGTEEAPPLARSIKKLAWCIPAPDRPRPK